MRRMLNRTQMHYKPDYRLWPIERGQEDSYISTRTPGKPINTTTPRPTLLSWPTTKGKVPIQWDWYFEMRNES